MADKESKEYRIPISTAAQLVGWIAGALWIGSEQIRDVAYMKDSLTHEVGPSMIAAIEYRKEMTKRVDEFVLVYGKDKEAIWKELESLRHDLERLEDKLHQMKP